MDETEVGCANEQTFGLVVDNESIVRLLPEDIRFSAMPDKTWAPTSGIFLLRSFNSIPLPAFFDGAFLLWCAGSGQREVRLLSGPFKLYNSIVGQMHCCASS